MLLDAREFHFCNASGDIPADDLLAIALEARTHHAAGLMAKGMGYKTYHQRANAKAVWRRFRESKHPITKDGFKAFCDEAIDQAHFGHRELDPIIPIFDQSKPDVTVAMMAHIVAYNELLKVIKYGFDSEKVNKDIAKVVLNKTLGNKFEINTQMLATVGLSKDMTDEELMERIKGLTGNGPQV